MRYKELGSRFKEYENQYAAQKVLPLQPIIARLDGHSFHTFTRGLRRPYDLRLSKLMKDTAKFLMEKSGARLAYTQSDEISLLWYNENTHHQTFFGGKINKMTSILASLATAYFNKNLPDLIPEKSNILAIFDARIFNIPNLNEMACYFIWRELDAATNSVSMAAQSVYSHNDLDKKSIKRQQEMLFTKGINWNDYPIFFKRGTYLQYISKYTSFSTEEINKLPAKHQAKTDPSLKILRQIIVRQKWPKLNSIENKIDVLLNNEKPILKVYNG